MATKDVEKKLKSNNPAYISYVFSKVGETLEKNENLNKAQHIQLVEFLEKKCIDSSSLVALTASRTMSRLVKNEVIQAEQILFDLLSLTAQAKNFPGLYFIINDILIYNLEKNKDTCYNLWSKQHPLISVHLIHKDTTSEVYNSIVYGYKIYKSRSNLKIYDLYLPVFYYLFCNPENQFDTTIIGKLWLFLLQNDELVNLNILLNICSWMQFKSSKRLISFVDLIIQFFHNESVQNNQDLKNALFVIVSFLLRELVNYDDLNPNNVIDTLKGSIRKINDSITLNLILLMVSQSLLKIPVNYLTDLLCLCEILLEKTCFYEFPLRCLQASLFSWIIFKSNLVDEIEKIKKIVTIIEKKVENSLCESDFVITKIMNEIKDFFHPMHLAIEFLTLSKTENYEYLIDSLPKENGQISTDLFFYINSLIIFRSLNETKVEDLLRILIREENKFNFTLIMSTVMYKLSLTKNPLMHFHLLKSLPKLMVCDENVPFILRTLQSLKKGPIPVKVFAMELFFEAWKVDSKYYSYLQNMLNERAFILEDHWEINVTKAWILNKICLERPELYGSELVGYLSVLLNKCGTNNGSLSSSLAIEGISNLCKSGIVDIYSTLKELLPKFQSENRSQVLVSFCNLLSTTTDYFEDSERYSKLSEQVTSFLWELSIKSQDLSVILSVYKSLSKFKIEQISETMPEKYKLGTESILSSFSLVNYKCWTNILDNNSENNLEAIDYLLTQLIEAEMLEFRNSTYHKSENGKEPETYNYLSSYSVLRSVANYVKFKIQQWNSQKVKSIYVQSLKILSNDYTKPLPPLDWCFLQELIHFNELSNYCIKIASHQVRFSGSARRFMENVISALNEDDLKVLYVYENLPFLCNSIQPTILKPFVERTLKFALENYEKDKLFFENITKCLKNTLSRDGVHEANKNALSNVLISIVKNSEDACSLIFETLLDIISELSQEHIRNFDLGDSSEKTLKLFIKVRIMKILKKNEFNWLNEILMVKDLNEKEENLILQELTKVIRKCKNNDGWKMWLLDLMCRTQAILAENEFTKGSLFFFCRVVMFSITFTHNIFSKNPSDLIKNEYSILNLFPNSLYDLSRKESWQKHIPEILEWLHNMSNCKIIPLSYQQIFYKAIAALRFDKSFAEKMNWMKYIDRKLDFVILQ